VLVALVASSLFDFCAAIRAAVGAKRPGTGRVSARPDVRKLTHACRTAFVNRRSAVRACPSAQILVRELAHSAHAPATRTALCSNWPSRPGNAPATRSSADAFGRARPARSGGPINDYTGARAARAAASSQWLVGRRL